MIAGKKNNLICFTPLASANHCFPFPLLFFSLEKVVFMQAEWKPACALSPARGPASKAVDRKKGKGICVMKSIVDLK